jgi:hypothetical protein
VVAAAAVVDGCAGTVGVDVDFADRVVFLCFLDGAGYWEGAYGTARVVADLFGRER